MLDLETLLYRLVFGALPLDKFEAQYTEDVADPADEICTRSLVVDLPKKGCCELYVLRGGFTVLVDSRGRWSLYESESRVSERDYFSRWNEFVRGTWTNSVPSEPGVYPVRDLEGNRGADRTLKLVSGRLVDVTRGFVGNGKVTEWRGQWYSLPYPPLRGAI